MRARVHVRACVRACMDVGVFRNKLQDQYVKQLNSLVSQWESDMQKAKDGDEKLQVSLSPNFPS